MDARTPKRRSNEPAFKERRQWGRLLDAMAVCALFATVAGFGGALAWWLDLFAHFRVQYVAGGILLLLAAIYLRRGPAAWVSAAVVTVNFLLAWPVLFPAPSGLAVAHPGTDLKVATVNLLFQNRDLEAVRRFMTDENPDLVVFQEANAWWRNALKVLEERYPYHMAEVLDGTVGLAVFSRKPWVRGRIELFPDLRLPVAEMRYEIDGRALTIIGTHLGPPGSASRYADQLKHVDIVADRVRRAQRDSSVILLGDLNATPWSEPFQRLAGQGALSLGKADVPVSWPSMFPPLFIPIDHVLAAGEVEILRRRTTHAVGSDHLPLVADIRLTR